MGKRKSEYQISQSEVRMSGQHHYEGYEKHASHISSVFLQVPDYGVKNIKDRCEMCGIPIAKGKQLCIECTVKCGDCDWSNTENCRACRRTAERNSGGII